MKRPRAQGFTLLELLLVLLLLSIVMGMAGLGIGRDPQRLASQEANLFLQLVQHARQQAVLEGVALGIRIDPQGYQLLKARGDSWEPAGQQRDLAWTCACRSMGCQCHPPCLVRRRNW